MRRILEGHYWPPTVNGDSNSKTSAASWGETGAGYRTGKVRGLNIEVTAVFRMCQCAEVQKMALVLGREAPVADQPDVQT
jgi:hypothetical protein